jgi:hypothetical protein
MLAGVLAILVGWSLIAIEPASADHAQTWAERWRPGFGFDLNLEVYFIQGFPADANVRNRISSGPVGWNGTAQTNPAPRYVMQTAAATNYNVYTQCGPNGSVTVHWMQVNLGNGRVGETGGCVLVGAPQPTNSGKYVAFDNGTDWYTGVGDAPNGFAGICGGIAGPCQVDLWSVAVHEFGHVSDLGHFSSSEAGCTTVDHNLDYTMCPFIGTGQEGPRTLETHDWRSFQRAYGMP